MRRQHIQPLTTHTATIQNKQQNNKTTKQTTACHNPARPAAVADIHNKNSQGAILDTADDSVITHAILPQFTKTRTFEGFTDSPNTVSGTATPKEDMDTINPRLKIAQAYVKELRK